MDQRHLIPLHLAWWNRTNRRPLVANWAPLDLPYTGLDLHVPPEAIAERKAANAAVEATIQQDLLVTQRVDFGPALIPALAGAGFQDDGRTSWNHPVAETCAQVRIPAFDPGHPLWVAYCARRDRMLDAWAWDRYLPAHTNNVGPVDILAGILGPDRLAAEVMDDPQGVAELALQAADFFIAVMDAELAALQARGPADGATDLYQIWLPGRGCRLTEDFSVLVGPRQVRDCFQPADRRVAAAFDSILFHTHSGAWRSVVDLVRIGGRTAVEFGTDPGRPGLAERISTTVKLQAEGLPVQYGSWRHPLTDAEIAEVVRGLDPRGLMIRLWAGSVDEAKRLHDLVLALAERS